MRIECTLPRHKGEWIERVDEISTGIWKRFRAAEEDATLALIPEIVTDWNLTDANGKPALKPKTDGACDALGMNVNFWIIKAITQSVANELKLSPNESGQSSD